MESMEDNELTLDEKKVLYWHCKGKKLDELIALTGYKPSKCYELQANALKKLRFTGGTAKEQFQKFIDKYGIILQTMEIEELASWDPLPEPIKQTPRTPQKTPLTPWKKIVERIKKAEWMNKEFRINNRKIKWWWVIAALIGIIVLVILIFLFSSHPEETAVSPTPTRAAAVVVPSNPTATAINAVPVDTPFPTDTAIPTPTPVILVQDDFEQPRPEIWDVVTGEVFISDGVLTTNQDTWLVVKNASWSNIRVELDILTEGCTHWAQGPHQIAVRYVDLKNMISFRIDQCDVLWFVVRDDKWTVAPNTYNSYLFPGDRWQHLVLTAENGKFTAFIEGKEHSNFYNTDFETGSVALFIGSNAKMDNFIVYQLP